MKNGIFYIILFFGFIYLYINIYHYEKFSNIRFLHIPKNGRLAMYMDNTESAKSVAI